MKQLFTFCFFLMAALGLNAQNPVSWTVVYKPISATEGEIVATAMIEKPWHMYSQKATEDGPIPTTFTFSDSKLYQLNGKTEESNAHEEFDKAFGAKIASFSGSAEFKQKVKLSGAKAGTVIPFKVEYMVCNDMTCLPPKTVDLNVKVQ